MDCAAMATRSLPSRTTGMLPSRRMNQAPGFPRPALCKSGTCPKRALASSIVHSSSGVSRLSRAPSSRRTSVRASAGVSDVEEEVAAVEETAMEKMEKTVENVRGNFNTVRTGRATPSLLDRVEVEYYGTSVTLKSIAQISAPDGATLLITPFDKSSTGSIEKAIMTSDVGLTPNSDGNVIRLSIPQLTSERRKELLKTASKLAEDGKVAIRNVRRDAVKAYEKLEKEKKLSEDERKGYTEDLQKLTDDYVKQIDALFKQKEKDLLTV